MQPISSVGAPSPMSRVTPSASHANAAVSPAVPFKDLLAEALSQSRGAAPPAASATTAVDKAQAALSAASALRDAAIGAFNEIKDLRI
jgi:flagellar hook-basal body complex protein FliE